MTPDEIKQELKKAIQEEINRFALNELTDFAHSVLDEFKSNLSEKPNSCDQNHYIPQPGEVVEVATARKVFVTRIFTRYDPSSKTPFMTVVNELTHSDCDSYRKGLYYGETDWRYCRRLHGEIIEFGCDKPKGSFITDSKKADEAFDKLRYTHLLPAGYEFCTEEDAEEMLKVEPTGLEVDAPVGQIANFPKNINPKHKHCYRPVRKIKYHVAIHETVTTEPNPYAVDWSNAPEWADTHAFDQNEIGVFYGVEQGERQHKPKWSASGLLLHPGLDWTKSKTVRPR